MKFSWLFFLLVALFSAKAQDRGLGYYIQAGLANSPLLKDYQNQVRSGTIDSLRIQAGYRPQVAGVSTNSYAPVIHGWGYDEAITNGANIGEQVAVSQQLVGKDNLHNQFEAIRLQKLGIDISRRISEQDLKKAIASQYITAFGSWQQYQYNQEVLGLLQQEEGVLKKLTEGAVYRQTDYLTFLVTLKQQEVLINQVRLQYQDDFATLNYLCGLQDTAFTPLDTPRLAPVELPDIDHTVYYHQYVIDSLKLRNQDAQIDFSYKPKLSLYADAGYLSSLAFNPYKNFGISAGVNLIVPIYDGHQRKMQHDKIAISEQTRTQYRDFFKSQYDQQVSRLFQQLQATKQLIDQSRDQLRYAKGLIEANKKLLQTGDARVADYIIAIGNYLSAENSITQNTVRQLQIINQLNYWNSK